MQNKKEKDDDLDPDNLKEWIRSLREAHRQTMEEIKGFRENLEAEARKRQEWEEKKARKQEQEAKERQEREEKEAKKIQEREEKEAQRRQEREEKEDKRQKEKFQEWDKQIEKQRKETEEFKRSIQEAHQKEAEERRTWAKESKKKMDELNTLFTGQWGKLIEALVKGDLIPLLNDREIPVSHIARITDKIFDGKQYEFDIIAINGDSVVVVEVKTTLDLRDIERFEKKLGVFKKAYNEYASKKVIGAL